MDLEQALARVAELEVERDEQKGKAEIAGKNLVNQRKEFEAEKKTLAEKVTELEGSITERDEKVQKDLTDYQSTRIDAIAKGDKEIADKIRAEYQNLSLPEDSREGIDTRAMKAYQLATAGTGASPLTRQADSLLTTEEQHDSTAMAPETQGVYERMFGALPETKN